MDSQKKTSMSINVAIFSISITNSYKYGSQGGSLKNQSVEVKSRYICTICGPTQKTCPTWPSSYSPVVLAVNSLTMSL